MRGVTVQVVADAENWPYAVLEIDFAAKDRTVWNGARWFLGLSAQGISTIEYKVVREQSFSPSNMSVTRCTRCNNTITGDCMLVAYPPQVLPLRDSQPSYTLAIQGDNGYDTCCNFLSNSTCKLSPRGRQQKTSPSPDTASQYNTHDCPLPSQFTARVKRPMHVRHDGKWALVLSVFDSSTSMDNPKELACVAASFDMPLMD